MHQFLRQKAVKSFGKFFNPKTYPTPRLSFQTLFYSKNYVNDMKEYKPRNSDNSFDRSNNDRPRRPSVEQYVPEEVNVEKLFEKQGSVESVEMYEALDVKVEGRNLPKPIESIKVDQIPFAIQENVNRSKITRLTPVQKNAFAIGLDRRDLIAVSQTGSGKTLAFLVPMLSTIINGNLKAERIKISDLRTAFLPRALVIAPTRELVNQIYDEARKVSYGTRLKGISAVYGGASSHGQIQQINQGCEVLIGTPGRLQDFLDRGIIRLDKIEFLVLDEADRMLDMGFEPQIRDIIENYRLSKQRTTMMFSATFPSEIQSLARDFLKDDYISMSVGRIGSTTDLITQKFIPSNPLDLQEDFVNVIKENAGKKMLIFVERKIECDLIQDVLILQNIRAEAIHGDRGQKDRDYAIKAFKSGSVKVLVATDVASRGLDIGDIDLVVNFRMPNTIDQYVHRIGRTGRAGKKGVSISIITESDWPIKRDLIKFLMEHKIEVPSFVHELESTGTKKGGNTGGNRSSTARQVSGARNFESRQKPRQGRFVDYEQTQKKFDRPRRDFDRPRNLEERAHGRFAPSRSSDYGSSRGTKDYQKDFDSEEFDKFERIVSHRKN